MTDWAKILLAVEPHGKAAIIAGFAASFEECRSRAELSTDPRVEHFIAQCAHESAGFKTTTEYASGSVYNGRKDLGNTQPGDGPRYKGRGLIQLTGRANYSTYGASLGVDLEANPAQAANFPIAALTGAEYWARRKINVAADRDDIVGVTKLVNGGTNGLDSRKTYLARAKHAVHDIKGALTVRATEETAKAASVKKTAAGSAAAAVVAQGAHIVPAQHASVPWLLIVLGVALVTAAIILVRKSATHADAASRLTQAAQGA